MLFSGEFVILMQDYVSGVAGQINPRARISLGLFVRQAVIDAIESWIAVDFGIFLDGVV